MTDKRFPAALERLSQNATALALANPDDLDYSTVSLLADILGMVANQAQSDQADRAAADTGDSLTEAYWATRRYHDSRTNTVHGMLWATADALREHPYFGGVIDDSDAFISAATRIASRVGGLYQNANLSQLITAAARADRARAARKAAMQEPQS